MTNIIMWHGYWSSAGFLQVVHFTVLAGVACEKMTLDQTVEFLNWLNCISKDKGRFHYSE